jgi:hypothetical protein
LMYFRILQRQRQSYKFMKYKQKLNCLLATIMDSTISRGVLNIAGAASGYNVNDAKFLAGGRLALEKIENIKPNQIEKPLIKINQKLNQIKMQPTKTNQTPKLNKEKQEALNITKKLFAMGDKEIPLESIKTPAEFAGYMNYLSHVEGGWSDFRIPNPNIKPIEFKPMSKEKMNNFMNMAMESMTKTGGKRKVGKTRKNGRK